MRSDNDGIMECPNDRSPFLMPARGVPCLPKNFALLDVLRSSSGCGEKARVCELCDEQHAATWHCFDCQQDLCSEASRSHLRSKATKDHRVVTLEQLRSSGGAASRAPSIMCPEHPSQAYRYYDTVCKQLICLDCFALKHVGHACQSLEEAGALARHQLPDLASRALKRADVLDTSRSEVVVMKAEVESVIQAQVDKLEAAFADMRAALASRHSSLTAQLRDLREAKLKALSEQENQLLAFSLNMKSMAEMSRSVTADGQFADVAALQTRGEVSSALEQLDKASEALQLQGPCEDAVVWFAWAREELLQVLAQVGQVQSGEEDEGSQSEDGADEFLKTLGDLSEALEQDQSEMAETEIANDPTADCSNAKAKAKSKAKAKPKAKAAAANVDAKCAVYVSGLHKDCNSNHLRSHFANFLASSCPGSGQVTVCKVFTNPKTKESKCCGMIGFSSAEAAHNSLSVNGSVLLCNRIFVKPFKDMGGPEKAKTSGQEMVTDPCSVHISGVPKDVTAERMAGMCWSAGAVVSSKVMLDKSGKSMGRVVVTFKDMEAAQNAIKLFDKLVLPTGQKIQVKPLKITAAEFQKAG